MHNKISLYGIPCSGKTHIVNHFCEQNPYFQKCTEDIEKIQNYIATKQQTKIAEYYQKIHINFCNLKKHSIIDQGIFACYPYNIIYSTNIASPQRYLEQAVEQYSHHINKDQHLSIFILATTPSSYTTIINRLAERGLKYAHRRREKNVWPLEKLEKINYYYTMLASILHKYNHRILIVGITTPLSDIQNKIKTIMLDLPTL